jgi:hypothetical protein
VLVETDSSGMPVLLTRMTRSQASQRVTRVEEVWRISEEWWRGDPLARTYYRVLLADGRLDTLFHDDQPGATGGWYQQSY